MWRKIQDDTMWSRSNEPFCRRAAFVDLLLMTWATEKEFLINGNPVNLKSGQLITSYRYLATKWWRSVDWVQSLLKYLIDDQKITIESNSMGTVVTVCNWEIYQQNFEQDNTLNLTPNLTTSERPPLQNKECKRVLKNDKELKDSDCSKTEQSPPKKSQREIQNQWIEKVCSLWKDVFSSKIDPAAVQLLVFGRKTGDKVHGFKSYDALLQFISEMRGKTLTGDPFAYAKQVATLEQGVGQYQKRAWQTKEIEKGRIGNLLPAVVENLKGLKQ